MGHDAQLSRKKTTGGELMIDVASICCAIGIGSAAASVTGVLFFLGIAFFE
jgi:hypothetical protein